MNDKLTIAIIEDEPMIAENIMYVLELAGFMPKWFATAGEGLAFLRANSVALLVLDVGLPDGDGFELCKTIRKFSDMPIIFLTARNDEIDRVVGLEIGADDYVTKPFSPREMLARIKLRIKAHTALPEKKPTEQELTDALVAENFDYSVNDQCLNLTAVEFKILNKLIAVSGNVLTREQLMIAAEMAPEAVYERNIDTHIKAIRSKLKPFKMAKRIRTKRGFGYFYHIDGES